MSLVEVGLALFTTLGPGSDYVRRWMVYRSLTSRGVDLISSVWVDVGYS